MTTKRKGKPRTGRPKRTDAPVRIGFRLAGELRLWLQARSQIERRAQNDIVSIALEQYRERVERRKS